MAGSAIQEAREQLEAAQVYRSLRQNEKAICYFAGAARNFWKASMPQQAADACAQLLRLDPRNLWAKRAFHHAQSSRQLVGQLSA